MKSIVITGFMGAGKSTAAQLLAQRLGLTAIDLDQRIADREGRSIAEIFAREGEEHFRRLERETLAAVLDQPGTIIATGGGTLVAPEAMALARSRARVVALEAPMEVLWQRIGGDPQRPLVAAGREAVERLKLERDQAYRRADVVIGTAGRTPESVVDEIIGWVGRQPDRTLRRILEQPPGSGSVGDLEVPLGDRTYRLEFQSGGRHQLGARIASLFPKSRRVVVITNPTVGALYYADIEASLRASGLDSIRIDIPDSEGAKCLAEVERVLDLLSEQRLERAEPLVALGGGVVGDLTGFVASIYLRGIPFVQVPTTLLSQVDSSIGGKTGVNSRYGKNLIGSFYQPKHVLIDVEVLKTLPPVEFRAGMAEVIKYGAIRDRAFLQYLERERTAIEGQEAWALEAIIYRSCAHKAEVVVADEREQGERALLNFGHTLGHAFEALGEYRGLKHGEAVAVGMVFAAELSRAEGLLDADSVAALTRLLMAYGLPVRAPDCTVEDCLRVMASDKKVSRGAVKFVLLKALGEAILRPLNFDRIADVLRDFLEVRT